LQQQRPISEKISPFEKRSHPSASDNTYYAEWLNGLSGCCADFAYKLLEVPSNPD